MSIENKQAALFKKSAQKFLLTGGIGTCGVNAPKSKSFLVTFFQKSNCFLPHD
jgi:hypothetical protein